MAFRIGVMRSGYQGLAAVSTMFMSKTKSSLPTIPLLDGRGGLGNVFSRQSCGGGGESELDGDLKVFLKDKEGRKM